jgi:two-component system, NtrC family, nitrogen regulation response regulator GlnG
LLGCSAYDKLSPSVSSPKSQSPSGINATTMEVQSVAPETFDNDRVLTMSIAFHPDWRRIGEQSRFVSPGTINKPIEISRVSPMFSRPEVRGQSPITDGFVSRKPVMLAGLAGNALRVWCPAGGQKHTINGAALSEAQEFSEEEQAAGLIINLADRVILILRRTPLNFKKSPPLGLIGVSPEIEHVRQQILKVADTSTPVLIHGETGSGKELVARAIHNQSLRSAQDFLAINMAAIPETTAVSQLFGHTKGAFSGAEREHSGYFGQADGGTLFMDEIGETSLETQAILLRVLETSKRQPVGSNEEQDVDVRVLTATDMDLDAAVRADRIREPLLHRLKAYDIKLPCLNERPEDIGPLFIHFLKKELLAIGGWTQWAGQQNENELWIEPQFVVSLIRHPWTGNVRELQNLVRKLVIANRGSAVFKTQDLLSPKAKRSISSFTRSPSDESFAPRPPEAASRIHPSAISEQALVSALKNNQWRAGAAADELGISRSSLYTLIEQNPNIRKAKDLSKDQIEIARTQCRGDINAMAELLQISKRALQLREKDLSS